MRKAQALIAASFVTIIAIVSCSKSGTTGDVVTTSASVVTQFTQVRTTFGNRIDLTNLANYANQTRPPYITKDNTGANRITNAKATLGRVLFYDKNLSVNNSVSCGSCHRQQFAFGDTSVASPGVLGGFTSRHTMRLVNARFGAENKFFWDERAPSLEFQTTQPIQNFSEMGFSGTNGRPGISTLLTKLQGIGYYNELFQFVYGDINVTEARMQECLAQFIRSIQSFDSKYDVGRSASPNDGNPFPNFTASENNGKGLFIGRPTFNAQGVRIAGGAGCNQCHRAPEFDIDPNSRNNGVIGSIAGTTDLTVTRSPSLRDIVNPGGVNAPLMHSGVFRQLQNMIGHYNNVNVVAGNNNLDPRLANNGRGQHLNLSPQEVNDIIAFMRTLSGTSLYTDPKWSNPF